MDTGALGAADFFSGEGNFSGNDNSALSSLAAAAGGGVTAISKDGNDRLGRASKKHQLRWRD
jgi:hypothetical protein